MQVHTPGPVFTFSLLKGMHTPTLRLSLAAVERQTSATTSQPQDDTPQLMSGNNVSQPDDSVSSNILAIVEGIEIRTLIDSGSSVCTVSEDF